MWREAAGEGDEAEVLVAINELVRMRPAEDATAVFEQASAYDYAGQDTDAERLYRAAIELGLDQNRHIRAVFQLASTLRNLGRPAESATLLQAEIVNIEDPNLFAAGAAFLSLSLLDCGRSTEAVAIALKGLTPLLTEYSVSIARYVSRLNHDRVDL